MGAIIAFSMIGLAFFTMGFVLYKTAIGIGGKTSLRGVAVKKEKKNLIYYNECRKLNGIRSIGFNLEGNKTFKVFLNVEGEKGEALVTIKDKKGNLMNNNSKTTEFEYNTKEKMKLNVKIEFRDFYGNLKLEIK